MSLRAHQLHNWRKTYGRGGLLNRELVMFAQDMQTKPTQAEADALFDVLTADIARLKASTKVNGTPPVTPDPDPEGGE